MLNDLADLIVVPCTWRYMAFPLTGGNPSRSAMQIYIRGRFGRGGEGIASRIEAKTVHRDAARSRSQRNDSLLVTGPLNAWDSWPICGGY